MIMREGVAALDGLIELSQNNDGWDLKTTVSVPYLHVANSTYEGVYAPVFLVMAFTLRVQVKYSKLIAANYSSEWHQVLYQVC